MRRFLIPLILLTVPLLRAQNYPQAEISSPFIKAGLYLPDAKDGFYRATRFDWSGPIYALRAAGHDYFAPWIEPHDPLDHHAIPGPVESYEANLGLDEAKPGEGFLRIGVGLLERPDEPNYRYSFLRTLKILDAGKWTVKRGKDWIEFTHEVADKTGYAYVYTKRISLAPNTSQMTISHTLRNTGKRFIETKMYNHNFFVLDGQPTGPGFAYRFPFEPKPAAVRGPQEFFEVKGREVLVTKALEGEQSALLPVEGYQPSQYDMSLENRNSGAGVRITSDSPLIDLRLFARKKVFCIEPYIQIRVEPGRVERFETRYLFYALK
jgi:hypothetical protein